MNVMLNCWMKLCYKKLSIKGGGGGKVGREKGKKGNRRQKSTKALVL